MALYTHIVSHNIKLHFMHVVIAMYVRMCIAELAVANLLLTVWMITSLILAICKCLSVYYIATATTCYIIYVY